MIVGRGDGPPARTRIEAPLVFVGYGLHMPEAGHDDFAGVDLNGKIAVVIGGGPADISGALKSHARSQRGRLLDERGAVGLISLTTPKAVEIPWARSIGLASQGGMYFADAALREIKRPFFSATFNPEAADRLFSGSGRTFAEIVRARRRVEAGARLRAAPVAARRPRHPPRRRSARPMSSAMLPGSDPALKDEYVVLTAHLDHLGIGEPVNGDPLFNGALDNAAGVASLARHRPEHRRAAAAAAALAPVRHRHGGGEGPARLALFQPAADRAAAGSSPISISTWRCRSSR